jgi:hypothetical protein
MKRLTIVLGIASTLFVACGTTVPVMSPSPTPSLGPTATLTEEQMVIAAVGARYKSNFYSSRADCVQAVDDETTERCVFPAGIKSVTRPEWEQLFPDTAFYLVDIGGWRSGEGLLAHESRDSGLRRHLAAWQNGQAYQSETFDRLLEANAVAITDTNRELVARSFALMSISNYLDRDVRFLEWETVDLGTSGTKYSHYLKAWTETWGCEVVWYFSFADQRLSAVSLLGGACKVSEYGDYIEDTKYFAFDCEAVPLGVPPYSQDYRFNR